MQMTEDERKLKELSEEADKLKKKLADKAAQLKSLELIEIEANRATLIRVVDQICTGKTSGKAQS